MTTDQETLLAAAADLDSAAASLGTAYASMQEALDAIANAAYGHTGHQGVPEFTRRHTAVVAGRLAAAGLGEIFKASKDPKPVANVTTFWTDNVTRGALDAGTSF